MKQRFLLLLFLFTFHSYLTSGQELYNREFRGVWMATVGNIDWPVKGASAASQKAALMAQFDKMKEANINVVFFQVRTEADALYRSSKEPWSRFLTGTQGKDPGYDPLQFAIEEAHKRGLELHAWLNPYRANYSTSASVVYDPQHVINSKPEWLLDVNGKKIMNPGLPAVRDYVTSVVMDVVDNYNIDGIHFDDYFYQYPPDQIRNEDISTYQQYGAGFSSIANWRRDNVNKLMKQINDNMYASKPEIRFGISPFGIWKNGVPQGITGMDAYNVIYADPVNWVQNHYVDYLTPQLYWKIGGNQDFRKLLNWWSDQAYANDRHLYTGHILSQSSYTAEEVPNQIAMTREPQYRVKNSLGSVHFRSALINNNTNGIRSRMRDIIYKYPSVPPLMEWKQGEAPATPTNVTTTKNEQTGVYEISWTRNPANTHEFKRYVVYALGNQTPANSSEIADGSVRALTADESTSISSFDLPMGASKFVITELSPANRESALSQVVTILKTEAGPSTPLIVMPTDINSGSTNNLARFQWTGTSDVQGFHYQWATNPSFDNPIEDNNSVASATTSKIFQNLQSGVKYYFRLRARNGYSWSDWTTTYSYELWPSSIANVLAENKVSVYPNPTTGPILVDFTLPKGGTVRADLFSPEGQRKVKGVTKKYYAGDHTLKVFHGKLVPGIYVLRLQINGLTSTHRVVIL